VQVQGQHGGGGGQKREQLEKKAEGAGDGKNVSREGLRFSKNCGGWRRGNSDGKKKLGRKAEGAHDGEIFLEGSRISKSGRWRRGNSDKKKWLDRKARGRARR
jgi:hypothetical protein